MSEIPAWNGAASPAVKFEGSPAESVLSAPDEMYPSLFSPSPASTIHPLDVLSPPASTCGDSQSTPAPTMTTTNITPPAITPALTPALPPSLAANLPADLSMLAAGISALTQNALTQPPPPTITASESEKKPVKKRKSWGQVLPEPKTNLPPRKRAKTEDEKEQRRVERVLRNRRAAQSSRERKRLEVEGLERRNKQLEAAVIQLQQVNFTLIEELQKMRQGNGSASCDGLRQTAIALSQQLFAAQGNQGAVIGGLAPPEPLFQANKTVNPASLSPTLTPIPEAAEEQSSQPAPAAAPAANTPAPAKAVASPDATQHPAEMLCPDLQCRSAEAPVSLWQRMSQQALHPAHLFLLQLQFLLTATSAAISACQRPLTQIAISLRAGSSLPPTRAILNTIIWLVTNPSTSRPNSTSTTSSPTSSRRSPSTAAAPSQTRRSSTLRLRTLRKILTCSPFLARPLMDATMAVLRLASTEELAVDRVSGADDSAAGTAPAGGDAPRPLPRRGPTGWLQGAALPSKEVLITLLWVLRVEERRLQIREQVKKNKASSSPSKPGTSLVLDTSSTSPPMNKTITNPTTTYVLKVCSKRSLDDGSTTALKKRRFS
ncbi:hypothetical protein VTJ04DRAFT_2234 [Mycothermus thermophilus]|uniref:uncharacterized protein n=1 Tax=Humicola insolens TaxID=85995 RepID=UPI003744647C